MNKILSLITLIAVLFFSACKYKEKLSDSNSESDTAAFDMEEWLKNYDEVMDKNLYRASNKRINDLLHTKLEVNFNWEKQQLNGKATLSFKPYFYPTDSLTLDAKGFDIREISLLTASGKTLLKFEYDSLKLRIKLDKTYTRSEEYKLFIDYTAKPEELEAGGSKAITSDKGLYFINPLGKDKNKPIQVWTQGETEASSCWFPTIDSPNERMTQEIYMTVDTAFVTLSNGLLVSSVNNKNGTRTDYWKQTLGHAPYLAMMAVSNFAIVKDKWKGIEVNYYGDKEYEKYAKPIFGNTPEMLTFFSEKFGNYPWEKYSQVVVHDYVSGAMENTSATLHGEFLHQTSREMLDGDNEDIISHELFHQWFGDLVTCESWSNLPLNESFATYGEYLWREYKYGRDAADHHLDGDLSNYLREAAYDKKDLIRFQYDDKEDMFDSHSYAKGSRVLHMLRKAVGDDAFFASLKLYLEKNKFTSVEVHQLRLAFEEVTGEDMNWFFNQWFLAKGHPDLGISWYYYDETEYPEEKDRLTITIEQHQDREATPLYRIPMYVDVYHGKEKVRHQIVLEEQLQTFALPCTGGKPDLVNIDAEKMLLCTREEDRETSEYIHQYHYAPLYLDRQEALLKLSNSDDSLAQMVVLEGLNDKYWKLRSNTISYLSGLEYADKEQIKTKVSAMAQNDEKAGVRAAALKYLIKNHSGNELLAVYEKAMNDSSYNVSGMALAAIAKADKEKGLVNAEELEKRGDLKTFTDVATVYMQYGGREKENFFADNYKQLTDNNDKYSFILLYSRFLQRTDDAEMTKRTLAFFKTIAETDNAWFMRLGGIQALAELRDALAKKAENLEPSSDENDKALLSETNTLRDSIDTMVGELIEIEKDAKVLRYLGVEEEEE